MRLKSIHFHNWMAFKGDQRIDDIPALPMAVIARYTENPRRSNWAGKTAFLEGPKWALYGVHRKNLDDDIIYEGEDLCFVEVVTDNGYTVRRTKPRGGSIGIEVTSPDGMVERGAPAEERIAQVLRLSIDDADATIFFPQGDTEAIVSRTSGQRRSMVNRWLQLDVWERYTKRARLIAVEALARHDSIVAEIKAAADMPLTTRTVADIDADRAALRLREDECTAERKALDDKWRAYTDASRDGNAEADLVRARANTKALREQLAAMPGIDPATLERLRSEETEAASALGVADREVRDARSLVNGGFNGQCPVTKTECPASEFVRNADAPARDRLAKAQPEHARLVQLHRSAQEAAQAAGRTAQARATLESRIKDSIATMQSLNERTQMRIARMTALGNLDPAALDADRQRATTRLAETSSRLRELDREQSTLNVEAQRAAERTRKQAKAAVDARIAALVMRAMGATGIPAKIAASEIHALEERALGLLEGTGLSFELAWERLTADPAAMCDECGYTFKGKRDKACPSCKATRGQKRRDELDILVTDGSGKVEDVSAKSGGAKVLVASAIRLAGGMMLREVNGSSIGFAFVDEPFGALDAENRDNLAKTFGSMLGSVGLEQAFIVSHDASLLDAMPARVLIIRDGEVSRMEIER